MSNLRDLAVVLGSRTPIVVIETDDEPQCLQLLRTAALQVRGDQRRPLFRWTVTDGLQRLDVDLAPQLHNAPPDQVLRHIRSVDKPGIYVLLDFHPYLGDPVNVRLLKDCAVEARAARRTLVLVSHQLSLPAELQRLAARFRIALPGPDERREIVSRVAEVWNRENPGTVRADPKALAMLLDNLAGLTRADTERLAHAAIYDDGAITASDLPEVMAGKYELLNAESGLGFEYDLADLADIGGLARLKDWLGQRRAALANPPAKLDPPRGLLLVGVQGCGKSLAARATAGILGRPLLRLEFGALYDKWHGETERKLREALARAEAMAPCVLWIDEMEKALATGDGDSGTSRRVLGSFLTWLAERRAPVFVVATVNDITGLPPELVRKGRFDEIFFVDLPDTRARLEILKIQFKKRDFDAKSFEMEKLAQASKGFSGAEIEQGLVGALYAAHARGQPLATGHILAEFLRTRPLSVVMAERVAALRAWARGRCVPAA
jgi:hypothetical protein